MKLKIIQQIQDNKMYIKDFFSVVFTLVRRILIGIVIGILPLVMIKYGYMDYISLYTTNFSNVDSIKTLLLNKNLYTGGFKEDIRKDISMVVEKNNIKKDIIDGFNNDYMFYGVHLNIKKPFNGISNKTVSDGYRYKNGEYQPIWNTLFIYDIVPKNSEEGIGYSIDNLEYQSTILHEFIHYINKKNPVIEANAYSILKEIIKNNEIVKKCALGKDCKEYDTLVNDTTISDSKDDNTNVSNVLLKFYTGIVIKYTGTDGKDFYNRVLIGKENQGDSIVFNELTAFSMMDDTVKGILMKFDYGKQLVGLYFNLDKIKPVEPNKIAQ